VSTATELTVAKEVEALRQNTEIHRWFLEIRDPITFVLGLPAKGGSEFVLLAKCDAYKTNPPAWHWYNRETGAIDAPCDTAVGGSFLHSNGVICARWNRLAYKAVDSRGPHAEWQIGDWMNQPETGGTRTLAAMAGRIAHELKISFGRRLG
jgi:hypothetical protein